MPATGAIIQSVSQTKGLSDKGLCVSFSQGESIAVSYDGTHYAMPSVEMQTKKLYPIVRPYFIIITSRTNN